MVDMRNNINIYDPNILTVVVDSQVILLESILVYPYTIPKGYIAKGVYRHIYKGLMHT
jgi:hypothetical protein